VVGYIIITLLQIVRRLHQWKNFENWSIIDEVIDKSKVPHFLWPTMYEHNIPKYIQHVVDHFGLKMTFIHLYANSYSAFARGMIFICRSMCVTRGLVSLKLIV